MTEKEKKKILTLPPTRKDREIQLKEIECKIIADYMGGKHQNTHISRDERLLFSIIYHDLIMPWGVSKNICIELGIPFNEDEFRNEILINFLDDYLDFGLPMDRLGRSEVKEILTAYFSGDEKDDDKKQDEKLIN